MLVVGVSLVSAVFILFNVKGHRNIFFLKFEKVKRYFLGNATIQKLKEIFRSSLRHWKDQSFYYKNSINEI